VPEGHVLPVPQTTWQMPCSHGELPSHAAVLQASPSMQSADDVHEPPVGVLPMGSHWPVALESWTHC
jgi:hypothetical protein